MAPDGDSPSTTATVVTADAVEAALDVPPARDAAVLDAEVRAATRPEPRDSRYPRTGRARVLRWLLILLWLGFATYVGYAAQQILPPIINGQPFGGDDLADDLLLGRLVPVLHNAPLLAFVPPLIVLALLVFASRAALQDVRRERTFVADHERWESEYHRRLGALRDEDNRRQAEVARQRAEAARQQAEQARHHAAAAHQRIDEAVQRGLGSALVPAGPPLDFSLLPEPEHFVGREDDLAWVEARLRQGGTSAIVAAIAGLGGIGKTALAAVAVRRLYAEGRFKDGIAVVSCLGRGDAAGVLRDVLLRFVPQEVAPPATLNDLATLAVNRLSSRDALVVLDNVEPELPLGDVLQPLRDAHLTVLLTARQTLPLPPGDRRALDLLSDAAALDLFAEWYGRANAAALSPAEHAAAQRIVAALGRHTLAVKLAGAQAADLALPLDQFAAQVVAHPLDLEDQGADATLALKERLMRSVDALPTEGGLGDVRRLFAALAAFVAPARAAGDPDLVTLVPSLEFGRRAAAAVGNALDLPDPDRALDLLLRRALLDKTTDETLPAEADRERLRLHPLLRELAAELLDDATRAAASLALAAFYADYANETPDAAKVPDAENIAGALEWAHEHAPDEERDALVAALCDGMRDFWRDRSRTRDSLRYLPWGIDAAERIARQSHDVNQFRRAANIAVYYGDILSSVGRLTEAQETYQADLDQRRQIGDRQGEGAALSRLGRIAQRRGRLEEAEGYFQQSLAVLREVQDRRGEGAVLSGLGQIAQARGRLEEAEGYFQQSLAIRREVQDRRGEGVDLSNLGQIAQARGRLEEAEGYFQQSLAIRREVQDRQGEGVVLSNLGQIAQRRGRLAEAEGYFQQSLAIRREVQDRQGEGAVLSGLGQIAQARGRLAEAEGYFQQSLAVLREVQDRQGEGVVLYQLALIYEANGEQDKAEALHRESLQISVDVQNARDAADSLRTLGRFLIEQHRGKPGEGCDMLRQAIAIYHQMGVPQEQEARELAARLGCDVGE